jgi:hypothetical protein
MSRRSATALLWGVAFAAIPVPCCMGASGCEPPLAGPPGGARRQRPVDRGGSATTGVLAWLAIGRALAHALVTGPAALLTARALLALVPRRAPLVVRLVCGATLPASLVPICYRP